MTFQELIDFCEGSPTRAARLLDTSLQNISGWAAQDRIPNTRQYEIQVKSDNRLIADSFDPGRDYLAEAKQPVAQR